MNIREAKKIKECTVDKERHGVPDPEVLGRIIRRTSSKVGGQPQRDTLVIRRARLFCVGCLGCVSKLGPGGYKQSNSTELVP